MKIFHHSTIIKEDSREPAALDAAGIDSGGVGEATWCRVVREWLMAEHNMAVTTIVGFRPKEVLRRFLSEAYKLAFRIKVAGEGEQLQSFEFLGRVYAVTVGCRQRKMYLVRNAGMHQQQVLFGQVQAVIRAFQPTKLLLGE